MPCESNTLTRIPGKPEGREGVWLITAETAAALIEAVEGETVHNFIGGGALFVGANWEKSHAIEHLRRPDMRIALLFPPNDHYKHQLVAVNEQRRWAWDIGPIEESRMEAVDA